MAQKLGWLFDISTKYWDMFDFVFESSWETPPKWQELTFVGKINVFWRKLHT